MDLQNSEIEFAAYHRIRAIYFIVEDDLAVSTCASDGLDVERVEVGCYGSVEIRIPTLTELDRGGYGRCLTFCECFYRRRGRSRDSFGRWLIGFLDCRFLPISCEAG